MRPACSFVIAAAMLVAITSAMAQQRPAQAPQAAPPAAPVKPYKPVALKLPTPVNDLTFDAFRQQIADASRKKDRAGLAKLVVAQDFFWEGENGDKADKKMSGTDNLVAALGLGSKDAEGWDILAGFAADPTGMPYAEKQGVVCAPADPTFDEKDLEELAKSTQTDPGDWAFPVTDGVEVRATAQAKAPASEKLGLHFVRVMPDQPAPAGNEVPMLKIATPAGKIGYVSGDSIAPLGNDQLCYVKDATGWKIAGFIGGQQ
jgi:hypothetical protein